MMETGETKSIKAVLMQGAIHPLEPIPLEWPDGAELLVEAAEAEAKRQMRREMGLP